MNASRTATADFAQASDGASTTQAAAIPFFRGDASDPALAERMTQACGEILRSGVYVLGSQVKALEESLAALLGGREVVAVNSGSDALVLALAALGVGTLGGGRDDDEVILPSYTFVACAEAVLAVGARPVFVDCTIDNFAPSLQAHRQAVGPRTRAVLAVGLFGDASHIPALAAFCRAHGLLMVEDIAQCLGATATGEDGTTRPAGTWGDACAMSFYPTKTLGAAGDAGALAFADARHARQARRLRNHGHEDGEHHCLGRNSRMDELQAGLLRIALTQFPRALARRRQIAQRYLGAWAGSGIHLPPSDAGHAWNYFVLRFGSSAQRDAVVADLAAQAIATQVYYRQPLHLQRALAATHGGRKLPHSESHARCALAIPMYPALRDDEVERIVEAVGAPRDLG
ncbi:DegT/DnrJ/EryC1/StrS aminotransferase family protein [Variovorax sp. OV329]|uniref:DegT/DnrJ/EryC1/StrS family aminotransferase n=1 Tax=Variovorax sp. OV329 TaxID=1882825 RepID=UPI0008E303DC|nr:DegT/DnrJ/EryC1/StrS family aminotransferase [Variovorax sp. OV329]SFM78161.1 dTDP-4-amino-4,6-dideoxygalactose transaminase [Variovorax sp. OV329]